MQVVLHLSLNYYQGRWLVGVCIDLSVSVSERTNLNVHAEHNRALTSAGVLLEKQLVLFCPNIGLLSTCVLSLIPLLRPFTWQSLLLPVLPDQLLGFLEAPVPFVIGVQVTHTPYYTAHISRHSLGSSQHY